MGVLTQSILEISRNSHYLTEEDRGILCELLGVDEGESDTPPSVDQLAQSFNRLNVMASTLYKRVVEPQDGTPASPDLIKTTCTILRQLAETSMRYADKIKAAERASAVEKAIIAALQKVNNAELSKAYVESLKVIAGE